MTASRAPRIGGTAVPMHVPREGPVWVLVVGEAPGPRGADKSGIPFFGDAAGAPLYEALAGLGAVTMPPAVAEGPWDGARFAALGLVPELHGVALGNAWPACPTNDGHRFRAPTRAELERADNLSRLHQELAALRPRGLQGVVALGRVAARTMARVLDGRDGAGVRLAAMPHPSAQGLLSMAPQRGRGARMADLQALWRHRCAEALLAAGLPAPESPSPQERLA
jgi:uracil-DNA glycosylase